MKKAAFEQKLFLILFERVNGHGTIIDHPDTLEKLANAVDRVTKYVDYRFGWFDDPNDKPINKEQAKQTVERLEKNLQWPATKTDISDLLSKVTAMGRNEAWAYIDQLIDKSFLLAQPKIEFTKGQRFPKYYINENFREI